MADSLTKALLRPRLEELAGRIGLDLQPDRCAEHSCEMIIASLEPAEEGRTAGDYVFWALVASGVIVGLQALWRVKDSVVKLWQWRKREPMNFVDPAIGTRSEPGPRLDIRRRQ